MLYEVVNDTTVKSPYCGPTAIAAITNAPISKVHKMARRIRGPKFRYVERKGGNGYVKKAYKAPIKGMHNSELLTVLKRLKVKPKEYHSFVGTGEKKQSLRAFMDDYGNVSGPFIVNVTNHYVAVYKGMICDTWTRGKPISFAEYGGRNRKVEKYWKF